MHQLSVTLCVLSLHLVTLATCTTISVCKQYGVSSSNVIEEECVGQTVFLQEKGEKGDKATLNESRLQLVERQMNNLKSKAYRRSRIIE